MAINKNSSAFTFGFAIVMVVIVGAVLAFTSLSLKDRQDKNRADKKQMDILKAIGFETGNKDGQVNRANASVLFDEYVKERVSVNFEGDVLKTQTGAIDPKDKEDPFNVDVAKDFRTKSKRLIADNKDNPEGLIAAMIDLDLSFPYYICEKNGETLYVVPMAGSGLWGAVWGYVALEDDYRTISGVAFDHAGETPGLGAEIKEMSFLEKFKAKQINPGGDFVFQVVKSGLPVNEHQVNGITGGTITSVGVSEMVDRTLGIYSKHFDKK